MATQQSIKPSKCGLYVHMIVPDIWCTINTLKQNEKTIQPIIEYSSIVRAVLLRGYGTGLHM